MPLSELQRTAINRLLTEYCAPDPRPEVRRELRHGFELGPSDVVLFEERPRYDRPAEWLRQDVAKFRWVANRRQWQLYCQIRDLKWHSYKPRPSAPDIETLLREVEADPTGIFWG